MDSVAFFENIITILVFAVFVSMLYTYVCMYMYSAPFHGLRMHIVIQVQKRLQNHVHVGMAVVNKVHKQVGST